ncbi:hypothetical protein FF38_13676, partial [Lucilia cuprina]
MNVLFILVNAAKSFFKEKRLVYDQSLVEASYAEKAWNELHYLNCSHDNWIYAPKAYFRINRNRCGNSYIVPNK